MKRIPKENGTSLILDDSKDIVSTSVEYQLAAK